MAPNNRIKAVHFVHSTARSLRARAAALCEALSSMMIWPHNEEFPHKERITLVGCGVSAILGALMPGLSWLQRLGSPLVVLFTFAVSYCFIRIILAIFGVVRPVGVAYAFFVFYGMLLAAVMFLIMFPAVVFDPEITDPGERAFLAAGTLPTIFGACAGVLSVFRRWNNAA